MAGEVVEPSGARVDCQPPGWDPDIHADYPRFWDPAVLKIWITDWSLLSVFFSSKESANMVPLMSPPEVVCQSRL